MKTVSYNNLIIVEPYKLGQGIKAEVNKGIALPGQKTELFGLKVLIDARLENGETIKAGSIAYLPEDILSSAPWSKNIKKCQKVLGDQQCLVLQLRDVSFIAHAE